MILCYLNEKHRKYIHCIPSHGLMVEFLDMGVIPTSVHHHQCLIILLGLLLIGEFEDLWLETGFTVFDDGAHVVKQHQYFRLLNPFNRMQPRQINPLLANPQYIPQPGRRQHHLPLYRRQLIVKDQWVRA